MRQGRDMNLWESVRDVKKRQDGRYKDSCEAFCLASPTVGYYSINIKMINEGRHQKNKAENQIWIHQRCHKAVLLH